MKKEEFESRLFGRATPQLLADAVAGLSPLSAPFLRRISALSLTQASLGRPY
ncbi:hypothetical protein [Flavobacterium album]|uniref:hypothetical protein n=1 Tax=Flavobacterium album TaxID=2175091 RepID=UPI0015E8241C|nr:hypothetical protein [Flavobacterium album]